MTFQALIADLEQQLAYWETAGGAEACTAVDILTETLAKLRLLNEQHDDQCHKGYWV